MSDDRDDNVLHLPARGADSGSVPEAPDIGDLFYTEPPSSPAAGIPHESPAGAAVELPPVRTPISPEQVLLEAGMTAPPETAGAENDDAEYGEEEVPYPFSLADRIGEWLEHWLGVARDRHTEEAPLREAEIARKTELLNSRTAQETALMEQNGKFHAALIQAKSDRAAAQGKADAARSRASAAGMSADKGGPKAGGGGAGGGGRAGGANRAPAPTGSGSGRTSGRDTGPNSPKGPGKSPERPSGGRNAPAKGNESSGGRKGRQNATGQGGGGSGKNSSPAGSAGGSGKNSPGSGGSGSPGKNSSGSGSGKEDRKGRRDRTESPGSPAAERSRGRQERAAARLAAREQRRDTGQRAALADRTKDRDQDRANRQTAWEERRAKRQQRAAAREERKTGKETGTPAAPGRTTFGQAVAAEAQRRWDERRAKDTGKAPKDDAAPPKDDAPASKEEPGKKPGTAPEPETGPKNGDAAPESGSAPKSDGAPKPEPDPKDGGAPKDKPGAGSEKPETKEAKPDGKSTPGEEEILEEPWESVRETGWRPRFDRFSSRTWGRMRGEGRTKPKEPAGERRSSSGQGSRWRGASKEEPPGPPPGAVRPEDFGFTVDSPGRPSRPPKRAPAPEEDIEDAVIVPDTAPPPPSPPGLPRAPEPHTARPGTTRPPTPQEDPMASQISRTVPGQAGLAAQHRTDITLGQYLIDITFIAVQAHTDKEGAENLAMELGLVAKELHDMAADLNHDHNIDTEFVNQVSDLADAAEEMKRLAQRCAAECENAAEAALMAADAVGRTYSRDIDAMRAGGLAHASAAAHH
ncbi:ATP/GTP-binding protein [Streptomyces filamentosus]|uniref:ATP/GTP-binding protein n=1 Tax=Streptomyces filamentosus TaxID=67294 RepID=UPI0036E2D21A